MMTKAMNEIIELIDLTSGNVVDDFDDVSEALAAIRRVASIHGWASVANLSLMRIAGDSQVVIAMQESLVRLVQASAPTPATTR
jgi:hypothetical protein